MRILSICRGAPGLGRVVPSVGLTDTLTARHGGTVLFASYSAGAAYLRATGRECVDLGVPDGLFIDSVAPQAVRLVELAEREEPDLMLVDGEFFLPAALAHLPAPIVYLANPHDVLGEPNTFRRVNRLLLAHASAVLISSLRCTGPEVSRDLVPGIPCLTVPPIVKDFPATHYPHAGGPRVLVSMGGGSINADPSFRDQTDAALAAVLTDLTGRARRGQISAATVVLGADASAPSGIDPSLITVIDKPVELVDLYATHEVFIARAGRNATAEALYCAIPTVLIPITADRHRGGEQADNAASAPAGVITHVPDWRERGGLGEAITAALLAAGRSPRRTGARGNEAAATFLARIHPSLTDSQGTVRTPAERH
jgi:UDP:flavonoid glycosyltransferase YjiC (YdhE family)